MGVAQLGGFRRLRIGSARVSGLDPLLARFTRHVPRFRGWHRMLEPLRRHYVRRYEGRADRWIVIDDFEGGLRMRLDRSALMASLIYWRGIHSYSEASLVRRFLPADGVFLDVGANQGELTLVAARRAPEGSVIAFEPVPTWFELLGENVRLNGLRNVRLVNAAVADIEGTHEMFAPADDHGGGGHNEGLSTFGRAGELDRPVGVVPTVTLDRFAEREAIDRVDVIKIDVEGAEGLVLSGARELLARCRPVLVLEWNPGALAAVSGPPEQLLRELSALGYRISEVDPFARIRPLPGGATPRFDTLLARHATRH